MTFFVDAVVEDYEAIFENLCDDLEDIANDMGEMSLYMRDGKMAVYEFSNSEGTVYPVIFCLSENGEWKISKF